MFARFFLSVFASDFPSPPTQRRTSNGEHQRVFVRRSIIVETEGSTVHPDPGANKGDDRNCCGKIPSLRRAGLLGPFNLPRQLRMSSSPTLRSTDNFISQVI